jgi:hypothetical protein
MKIEKETSKAITQSPWLRPSMMLQIRMTERLHRNYTQPLLPVPCELLDPPSYLDRYQT